MSHYEERLERDLTRIKQQLAMLAEPTPEGFAAAVLKLSGDEELRRRLGASGRAFVEANHTFDAHRNRLNGAYDWIEQRLLETSGRA